MRRDLGPSGNKRIRNCRLFPSTNRRGVRRLRRRGRRIRRRGGNQRMFVEHIHSKEISNVKGSPDPTVLGATLLRPPKLPPFSLPPPLEQLLSHSQRLLRSPILVLPSVALKELV